jgi:hypothetical protein
MKKYILFISVWLLSYSLYSQTLSPQGYTYQAVARDNGGNIIPNQSLPTRVTITSNSPGGPIQWQETHSISTNGLGVFTFTVGQGTQIGGQPNFSDIDWAINNMYMKVEVNFGTGYEDMGTTKLWSVPYSFYSSRAAVADSVAGVNNVLPAGIIVMWSGDPNNVPPGWALCNGSGGTPDLRGKFIVGFNPSDADYDAIGELGGSASNSATHSVTIDPAPQTFTTAQSTAPRYGSLSSNSNGDTRYYNHTHDVNIDIASFNVTTGPPSDTENRPPYFVLAYIIKL